jgi:thiosulfate/3-mercaptopyruvate sulfurtransferase
MADPFLPLLVEPSALAACLGKPELVIVDLSQAPTHARAHLPGAVYLDYSRLVAPRPPAAAALPDAPQLADALGAIGLTPDKHVVAYDEEGNGRAARFLWTLDVVGHTRASLLNGGLRAWIAEQHTVESGAKAVAMPSHYPVQVRAQFVADKDYVLAHLHDAGTVLLDARSADEYSGKIKRSAKGGHIPGAVNFNWMDGMDTARHGRLKTPVELKQALAALGVTPDKEIITYCQTHHRSAHTYFVLKSLGYPRLRAYPGSWSEWGNLPDTPVES